MTDKPPTCGWVPEIPGGNYYWISGEGHRKSLLPESNICPYCGGEIITDTQDPNWEPPCGCPYEPCAIHEKPETDTQEQGCADGGCGPDCGKPKEPSAEPMSKSVRMDAREWAREFLRIWGGRWAEVDEGLMIGWFANAIMRGYDEATWKNQLTISDLRSKLAERDKELAAIKAQAEDATEYVLAVGNKELRAKLAERDKEIERLKFENEGYVTMGQVSADISREKHSREREEWEAKLAAVEAERGAALKRVTHLEDILVGYCTPCDQDPSIDLQGSLCICPECDEVRAILSARKEGKS